MSTERERTIQMWTRGDYGIVGDWFATASKGCIDGLSLRDRRVLDVACGTGAVAIEAARQGAAVTGVDLTPSMLQEASRRADVAGVDIDWQEGSFVDLSGYEAADVVTSAFGVMFASEPAVVLKQLYQVCRPGGVISLAAWAPDGAFGGPSPDIVEAIPILGGGPDITRWATEEGLSSILQETQLSSAQLALQSITQHVIEIPFSSTNECIELMIEHSGPWGMLFDLMRQQGIEEKARGLLLKHLEQFSIPVREGIHLRVSYVIARFQSVVSAK